MSQYPLIFDLPQERLSAHWVFPALASNRLFPLPHPEQTYPNILKYSLYKGQNNDSLHSYPDPPLMEKDPGVYGFFATL